jgi:acetyltransferase-like isoleucine patch superfamily enzyme
MEIGYRLRFYCWNWRLVIKRLFGQRAKIDVGDHTYGVPHVRWWGEASGLRVGKFCSIARDVTIFLGGNHRTDWITTYPFNVRRPWRKQTRVAGHPWSRGDVQIGNDVWLGEGCTILSGVTIGDGGVVAARSVVSRDVPPYAIVAGNPARVVRIRFASEEIARLLELRWWDWRCEVIAENIDVLLSPSLADLRPPGIDD